MNSIFERGPEDLPRDMQSLARGRLDGIDLLRGLVIVIMALDHVKGNFSNGHFDALDLSRTTEAYFLTRWISHFCAPTFVFLAGTGAFLFGERVNSRLRLAWFLLSRGLWLVFLELTVVRFSWTLELGYSFAFGQVLWAIGWSMVCLAFLVFLPLSAIATFGIALVAFHNLFDAVRSTDFRELGWLWSILHTGNEIRPWEGFSFAPYYPLIPWIGVMAVGYCFGAMMLLDRPRRRIETFGLGLALTLLFIGLRYASLYGDKLGRTWAIQEDWLFTTFSFVNCQKYPPSLVFLLMTLGPALCALAIFDREPGPVGRFFVTFGRVPLFFYLLHFYVIKALAVGVAYLRFDNADWLLNQDLSARRPPPDNGFDLWVVYLIWAGVVLSLYPLCRWFAGVKRRSRSVWLSYL